jgi:dTDP-4-dehydrorhamnose 3,5-epimerase
VLRGLHLQLAYPQGKLVTVLDGEILDVAVDVRRGSPTFARFFAVRLSAQNRLQLWIPPGFAHGFQVVAPQARVLYELTEVYRPDDQVAVAWDDPTIGIDWPLLPPELSPRDRAAPRLADVSLPTWLGA